MLVALILIRAAPAQERLALLFEIDGPIGPATTDYLTRGLDEARERGAELVILRMDTPGGLDAAMREIIQAILAAPVPVVTYVAPSGARAASAGTYILYASHIAAMAPGTNLGAATPIQLGGPPTPLPGAEEEPPPEDGAPASPSDPNGEAAQEEPARRPDRPAPQDAASAKAINDAVAYIRGLAELRGRNADWAEQAVRTAASLPAGEALDRNVIDVVARDLDALLAEIDGRTEQVQNREVTLDTDNLAVERIEPDWRTRLLATLTNPNVAYLLMLVGVYGLIFELASPGIIFPGVIGAISLLLGLFALNVLPIDYAGAGLAALGLALMVAEVFVPSFGFLGIGGLVAFALGSIIMFDTDVPGFGISLPVVGAATVTAAALLLLLLGLVLRTRRHAVVTGREALLGAQAEVTQWNGGHGLVHVHGETWRARADRPLQPGMRVKVVGREALILIVEPEPTSRPMDQALGQT